jgi:hypothetical protein
VPSKPGVMRNLVVAALVAGAFAGAFYLGRRKRTSRLDAFARCLAAEKVQMYGLYWCTHCAEQKELFGSSFKYIPYLECGIKGSRNEQPVCLAAGVREFPTWQFQGERHEGVLSLPALSQKSGCPLP